MTIHVNIGDAKTRLSQLVAAAIRGEDVVLSKAGAPQVRLVPVAAAVDEESRRIAEKRRQAIGMFRDRVQGLDLDVATLKSDRVDSDMRSRLHRAAD